MINSGNIHLSWANPTFLFNGVILSFGFPKIHHCIFSRVCVCVCVCVCVWTIHSVMSNSLWPMDCSPPGSSVHRTLWAKILEWNSGQKILEWVAISFSRGSFRLGDWTWVSCVAGGFFTIWATKKEHHCELMLLLVFNMIQVENFGNPTTLESLKFSTECKLLWKK